MAQECPPESWLAINGHPVCFMAKVAKTAETCYSGILETVCQFLCVCVINAITSVAITTCCNCPMWLQCVNEMIYKKNGEAMGLPLESTPCQHTQGVRSHFGWTKCIYERVPYDIR